MAGRMRKDTVDMQNLIINLAKCGMTNTQIAEVTGLARCTIQQWLSDNAGLKNAIETVRKANVTLQEKDKQALYSAAIKNAKRLMKARTVEETETRTDGNGDVIFTSVKKKTVEPNSSIVQFILKSIDPDNFGDKTQDKQEETETDNELKIVIDGGEEADADTQL